MQLRITCGAILISTLVGIANGWPAHAEHGSALKPLVPEDGSKLFSRIWTPQSGLGPLLNAQSCVACHAHPSPGGTHTKRGDFVVISPEIKGASGGRVFQLFQIRANDSLVARPLPRQAARRKPPSLFGLGLLEAARLARATNDGIRHQPQATAGRFGWKGQFKTIDEAVAAAFANELGLLGPSFAPESPELTGEQIASVSQFVRMLPPPSRRFTDDSNAGRRVFDRTGCGTCHTPSRHTGRLPVAALSERTFEAYTDLALHDLGPALGDGFDTGTVRGSEFRTPPLWGLSQSGPPYLHDGRADTMEGAIELHRGEAEKSRLLYLRLSVADRRALLAFLQSL